MLSQFIRFSGSAVFTKPNFRSDRLAADILGDLQIPWASFDEKASMRQEWFKQKMAKDRRKRNGGDLRVAVLVVDKSNGILVVGIPTAVFGIVS